MRNIYIPRIGGCHDVINMTEKEFYKRDLRYICTLDKNFDPELWDEDDSYNIYEGADGKLYGIYSKLLWW